MHKYVSLLGFRCRVLGTRLPYAAVIGMPVCGSGPSVHTRDPPLDMQLGGRLLHLSSNCLNICGYPVTQSEDSRNRCKLKLYSMAAKVE
jgi:hypothetical protein